MERSWIPNTKLRYLEKIAVKAVFNYLSQTQKTKNYNHVYLAKLKYTGLFENSF